MSRVLVKHNYFPQHGELKQLADNLLVSRCGQKRHNNPPTTPRTKTSLMDHATLACNLWGLSNPSKQHELLKLVEWTTLNRMRAAETQQSSLTVRYWYAESGVDTAVRPQYRELKVLERAALHWFADSGDTVVRLQHRELKAL
jgi:hypothetical protein